MLSPQSPRYSARNTAKILVKFSTVGRCMFCSVSSRVCQNFGKGVAMTCSTGTPGDDDDGGEETERLVDFQIQTF